MAWRKQGQVGLRSFNAHSHKFRVKPYFGYTSEKTRNEKQVVENIDFSKDHQKSQAWGYADEIQALHED